jgi:hypothetical protein
LENKKEELKKVDESTKSLQYSVEQEKKKEMEFKKVNDRILIFQLIEPFDN